ncbi:MAG: thiamine pyrophosphate-dependent enzyme [Desulfobacterales bacterium]
MKHLTNLAQQIAARGIKHVFGIPGSGPSLHLLNELEKLDVRFHLTHFEGSAALMAGAFGKLSKQSGVAISIKGPGLTNLLPGLAACCLEAFPVVSISEAYLPGAPPESSHKRIAHDKLLAGIAKVQAYLSDTGPDFESLCQLAESEVPGVAHLNIAASPGDGLISQIPIPQELDKDADLEQAIALIQNASKPVVIAGTLAVRKNWSEYLNRLTLPVFSTAAAKGVVNESLPHAGGVFTAVGGPLAPETSIMPQADLVISLGLRHNEVLAVKRFDCPAVHIDPLGEEKSFGFKFNRTAADTVSQIDTLFETLAQKSWGLELIETTLKKLNARMFQSTFLPANVYAGIARHFNKEARLVLDTGNFCTIGEHAWQVPRPDLYLAAGQGRYMGVGIPFGVGAALYDPRIPTVVFTGDGGIGMFISEMKLAVKHHLPLLVVLLSDAFLGTIRGASITKGYSQQPTAIDQPSWLKTMEGLGIAGQRISNSKELATALEGWSLNGPLYFEVPFDADEYQGMTDGIR